MDLAAPVLWKSIRSLSRGIFCTFYCEHISSGSGNTEFLEQTECCLSMWYCRHRAACLGRAKALWWWTELWSPHDLPIQAAWSGSWANINIRCCLGFSGYFYIVNKKPQGLFSGPEANWPSVACMSTATVTLTEESECIQSTTGRVFLPQAHAWALSCRVPGCSNQSGVTQLLRF